MLVARFAGAGDHDKVNRDRLPGVPHGGRRCSPCWRRSATCSPLPARRWSTPRRKCAAEALPFLRINFVFSIGMLLFFMLVGGAARRRRRADAAAPRHHDDGAERRVQRDPDPRTRPDSGVRHRRLGDRHGDRRARGQRATRCGCCSAAGSVVRFAREHGLAARLDDHPSRCSGSGCRPACRASP